jgi:hypothetical protein
VFGAGNPKLCCEAPISNRENPVAGRDGLQNDFDFLFKMGQLVQLEVILP